jgi:CRISPR-associated protein Csm3
MTKNIQIKGRVFVTFNIKAVTGLHIGGADAGIEIGGVDKTVVRDPLTNRPYIPGSSLKGKLRSLLEKYHGLKQNQRMGASGYIHSCGAEFRGSGPDVKGKQEYLECDVCQVFGVPGERDFSTPTRLVVRDTHLTPASAARLDETGRTDLPYTEVKTEVSIDRVTSAANPRQMERVPAGSVFGPAELIYTVYDGDDCSTAGDIGRLTALVEGMQLLEDDYLGGLGTRGSGKIAFESIRVQVRTKANYLAEAKDVGAGSFASLAELIAHLPALQDELRTVLA